jgi:hypothetical protein
VTVQDLIEICRDEDRDPKQVELVASVSGQAFDVHAADQQDPWNENWVMVTLSPREVAQT